MNNVIDLGIMDVSEASDRHKIEDVPSVLDDENNISQKELVVFDKNGHSHEIEVAMRELNIDPNQTLEELLDECVRTENRILYHSVRQGIMYMAVQNGLKTIGKIPATHVYSLENTGISSEKKANSGRPESTFLTWITNRGLSEQRVYEKIGLAKLYLAIPEGQRKSYLSLSQAKAVKLASVGPESIKEVIENNPDKLDEFALMSRAEMKAEINRLKKRVSEQNTELELKSKSIAKLQNRRRTTDFTQETEDVRAECLALQAECELPINSLEKLFEEHVNSSEKEYWERMGQIWITVNVVCARAVDLSTRMKDLLGEDNLPKRIQTEHTMLPDEAERWILDYRRIVNDHENARYERQRKREEAAPRGRGRPRKIAQ